MTADRLFRIAWLRLRAIVRRDDLDRELDEELQTHLERRVADNLKLGMSPDEAAAAARRAFGGVAYHMESARDARGTRPLDDLASDLRYAFRSLRRGPGFTLVVIITLALGIGANAAIFSVVRGVLLKPLPQREGDRLLYLRQSAAGPGQSNLTFSVPEVRDLRAGVPSLAGIAEFSWSDAIHETDQGPVRITVGLVTGNYFDVMGLSAVLGRVTQPGDDGPSAQPVAVLSNEYWKLRFGGDSGVIGRRILLDSRPVRIIGVLQPAPFFPSRVDALLNLVNSAHHLGAAMQSDRTHRMTEVVARLKSDATIDQARAEVATVYGALRRRFPEAYPPASQYRVALIPFKEVLGERAHFTLLLLMAAAAFVLIVSAANVANLTLMRGSRRQHELVVRLALGAGTGRLRRLLLVENLLLTLGGAGLGIVIAMAGVPLLTAFAARYSPRTDDIRLDVTVFAFTLAIAAAIAAVLAYLASIPRPGSVASRVMTGAKRSSADVARQRVQRALVVVQVAVTIVLLAGAGLLTRTMIRLVDMPTGLVTEDVLSMELSLLKRGDLGDPIARASAHRRFEEIRSEITALPGVTAVGFGTTAPLRTAGAFGLVQVEGKPPAPGEPMLRAEFRGASADFFRAAGIPLMSGRPFLTSGERPDAVVINQTLANLFFPRGDAVGKRIAWKIDWAPDTLHPLTIVGVAGDTRDGAPDAAVRGVVFMESRELPVAGGVLVVRASGETKALMPVVTRIIRRVAPAALMENAMTLPQFRAASVAPRRLNAVLISTFGILATIISAVGIAGVLAFSVGARTHEIGIRMSLGADAGRVQRMILREGSLLVTAGIALGILGALSSAGLVRGLLFGVEPHDPMTLAAVTALMALIGMAGCWIPAVRAARIDPAIAMRAE